MGTFYMLPNSWIKGIKLELLAVVESIFKLEALWKEITNPAAYNTTIRKYMVAPDPMLLVFLPVLII